MIKFSPRKTSTEQSLKVFFIISYIFIVLPGDSNVNNHISKKNYIMIFIREIVEVVMPEMT